MSYSKAKLKSSVIKHLLALHHLGVRQETRKWKLPSVMTSTSNAASSFVKRLGTDV
jgi:hypothetical protein